MQHQAKAKKMCAECKTKFPPSYFSTNQKKKKHQRKCRECVSTSTGTMVDQQRRHQVSSSPPKSDAVDKDFIHVTMKRYYAALKKKEHSRAVVFLEQLVDKGHPKAIFLLGVCYAKGRGVDKDAAQAFFLFTQAAELSYPDAFRLLGGFYEKGGGGVAVDYNKAIFNYLQADALGANVCFILGKIYVSGLCGQDKNEQRALFFFEKGWETFKCLSCCRSLGYYAEVGIPDVFAQDAKTAFSFYSSASAQGHTQATLDVSRCHRYGIGVPQSVTSALEFLKHAACLGSTVAHRELGLVFRLGQLGLTSADRDKALEHYGVAASRDDVRSLLALSSIHPDEEESHEYLVRAVRLGSLTGMYMLGDKLQRRARQLSPGSARDDSMAVAFEWLKKAADGGHSGAQYSVGRAFDQGGEGVGTDRQESERYFTLSAEKGDPRSLYALGSLAQRDGKTAEAICFLRRAADKNQPEAQLVLSRMYRDGNGVERSDAKRVELLFQASGGGLVSATMELSNAYLYGNAGLPQDTTRAASLCLQAINHPKAKTMCCSDHHSGAPCVHGKAAAFEQMGNHYFYGLGIDRNMSEASRMFSEALKFDRKHIPDRDRLRECVKLCGFVCDLQAENDTLQEALTKNEDNLKQSLASNLELKRERETAKAQKNTSEQTSRRKAAEANTKIADLTRQLAEAKAAARSTAEKHRQQVSSLTRSSHGLKGKIRALEDQKLFLQNKIQAQEKAAALAASVPSFGTVPRSHRFKPVQRLPTAPFSFDKKRPLVIISGGTPNPYAY